MPAPLYLSLALSVPLVSEREFGPGGAYAGGGGGAGAAGAATGACPEETILKLTRRVCGTHPSTLGRGRVGSHQMGETEETEAWPRERERVWVREKERSVCVREREGVCVYVCVCVCERERERERER